MWLWWSESSKAGSERVCGKEGVALFMKNELWECVEEWEAVNLSDVGEN